MLTFCVDQFSRSRGAIDWNVDLQDSELNKVYGALPDTRRWHFTNLLLLEESPMLWFYFQRTDSERARKSERQLCKEFVKTTFARVRTERDVHRRKQEGTDGEPVRMFFLLVAPENGGSDHLHLLAKIARLIKDAENRKVLLGAKTPKVVLALFSAQSAP